MVGGGGWGSAAPVLFGKVWVGVRGQGRVLVHSLFLLFLFEPFGIFGLRILD